MWWAGLILGILGSLHCVGMCGPIAFLLPLDRKSATKRFFEISSYHFGRLFTYASLGFLFGWLGQGLSLFGLQQQLSIVIGLLMISIILIPKKFWKGVQLAQPIYHLVGKIKSGIGLQLKKKDPGTFLALGVFNGLLPCGLVYMALFGAIGTGSVFQGSLYMFFFGLGTIPLMTTAIYLSSVFKSSMKQHILKWIPAFVVVIGLLFVLRGLGLGIPYVSPADNVAIEQTSAQHSCHSL